MAEIKITEVDATTPGRSVTTDEVAFIPGFSVLSQQYIIKENAITDDNIIQTIQPVNDFNLIKYYIDNINFKSWHVIYPTVLLTINNTLQFQVTPYQLTNNDNFIDFNSKIDIEINEDAETGVKTRTVVSKDENISLCCYVTNNSNYAYNAGTEQEPIYVKIDNSQYYLADISYGVDAETTYNTRLITNELSNYSIYLGTKTDTNGNVTSVSVAVPTVNYIDEPDFENKPILCTTIQEFENYFGEMPYQFTTSFKYSAITNVFKDNSIFININDFDRSYIYAKELLNEGMAVMYYAVANRNSDGTINYNPIEIYNSFENIREAIKDRGSYSVKYITTGGYPLFGDTSTAQDNVASFLNMAGDVNNSTSSDARGDCVVLIDHINNPNLPLIGSIDNNGTEIKSIYSQVKEYFGDSDNQEVATTNIAYAEYGAMFTPYASYNCVTMPAGSQTQVMPASFAYLISLAKSLHYNPSWLAIAGVTRGLVPNIISLATKQRLSNAIADSYQPRNGVAINAITDIKPYGLTIWGNRTLKNNKANGNLTATSFLNIRNMVSDVKKIIFRTCQKCMFEQNNDILWINFQAQITPTLEQMISGSGLSGYKIIKGTTTEKAKLVATVILYPLYALESIEVEVRLEDEEISVN